GENILRPRTLQSTNKQGSNTLSFGNYFICFGFDVVVCLSPFSPAASRAGSSPVPGRGASGAGPHPVRWQPRGRHAGQIECAAIGRPPPQARTIADTPWH